MHFRHYFYVPPFLRYFPPTSCALLFYVCKNCATTCPPVPTVLTHLHTAGVLSISLPQSRTVHLFDSTRRNQPHFTWSTCPCFAPAPSSTPSSSSSEANDLGGTPWCMPLIRAAFMLCSSTHSAPPFSFSCKHDGCWWLCKWRWGCCCCCCCC